MGRCALALLLVAYGAARAALADEAIAVIDACIHNLDPTIDVGYARVIERCPELARTLAASAYAPWLPSDWNKPDNDLSVGGLVELRRLLTRPEPAPRAAAPQVAHLTSVLAGLQRNDRAQHGWWGRFKQWLREVFTPQPGDTEQGWLGRLLGGIDLSQNVVRLIVWVALLLVLLLAGAVVVNELRIAGLLRSGQRRGRSALPGNPANTSAASLDDVGRGSPAEQPHLLLQLIVRRLIEQKRLPPARALTLHELERAARLRDEVDRERLAALADACERARFAEHVAAPVMAAALLRGRELLASLEAPPGQPAGAS
jgi:hypothetical protein